ncbi:Flp family type IVb pilin [Jannaschia pohangensis]|uniref:Uncharacterized protein n=1 Tax=Jannaschia pohangensis TaxID=390807 RepID=A0A1I3N9B2_9RHOB|nr:hypothetical protein SAMN04488095_2090 [Jannaschia pohangensis]
MKKFSMPATVSRFVASEDGAVTVDWVVLAAALTSLGVLVALAVSDGVENLSGDLSDSLADRQIAVEFTRSNGGISDAQMAAQGFAGGALGFNGDTGSLSDAELDALSGWVNDVRIGVSAASPSEREEFASLDRAVNDAYVDRARVRPTGNDYNSSDLASAGDRLDLDAARTAASG